MAWYENMMQPSTVTPKSPNFDWYQRFTDIGESVHKAGDAAALREAYAAAEKRPRGDIEALQAEKAQLAEKLKYLEGQLQIVEASERAQAEREQAQQNMSNAWQNTMNPPQNPPMNLNTRTQLPSFGGAPASSTPAGNNFPSAVRNPGMFTSPGPGAGYVPNAATPSGLATANMQGYNPLYRR